MAEEKSEGTVPEGDAGEGEGKAASSNFIKDIINEDIKNNKNNGQVVTRFPPEPNGYLHIGHAKSICLNFGLAREYRGRCHLRFDDTNPEKEETEYIESIMDDVKWLGFDWGAHLYYASDYFEQLYQWAVKLIKEGKAYVCDLSAEEMRQYRGTLTAPGKESPYRNRSVEENLDLFERMRAGEFEDGSRVLRAKIDMASGNINMRDPAMYRIMRAEHPRIGKTWCIYPTYDFTHGQSDSIENITHSICTLEFENHRPLYDWFCEALEIHHPQQIEFARLNLTYTVMSKRKLLQLVKEKHVKGWDDPRMPTISGLRRRGYTPEAIRDFAERIGVAKADSTVDITYLEHCLREDLNKKAPRIMAVLNPLKLVITNYPEGKTEEMLSEVNPEDASMGMRKIPFSRELYIERDDFMEVPARKFFRLFPGGEVRLKNAYIIKCEEVIKDDNGEVVELRCTYDPQTKSGEATAERKVKGTLHWVSVPHAAFVEVRLYDHLFTTVNPDNVEEDKSFLDYFNPGSLTVLPACPVEPGITSAGAGDKFQFFRHGYFSVDPDSKANKIVVNRTASLKDSWAKIQKANA
ncbi:MAG TPA: glutamine--tRNA ligase/YqeY domain fusion protein [Spirochaetota bacterium]|nr:glutamine--tRNA ligase/YqeY domain fusion protein [Spirochaetota bacterium]HPI90606.1 glutamine--tRNA ligase/YqeY domain fusion protein [Spirochaetota bacterium]HPR47726.1 glutamine--tRNA ligase/YqeY domain fusion protein [Spirochaetota bacterium]